MSRLDQEPKIIRIASELGLDWRHGPVEEIVQFCIAKIRLWLGDHSPVRNIGDLERLVCERVNLKFEEVWTDEDLQAVVRRYVSAGDPVFLTIPDDLDEDTYAVLLRLNACTVAGQEQFVAVVDCRGNKSARRFFSRWHEIAHLLTMTRQLELPYHRSTDKPPEERLMDFIAGEIGFYDPLFRPTLLAHVGLGESLTFKAVENIRDEFCPEASFQATLIAAAQRLSTPVVYLEAGLGLKASEKRLAKSGQASFLPSEPPEEKLRALVATSNGAARDSGFRIDRNMSVPLGSLISKIFRGDTSERVVVGEESLLLWRHSDGKPIGHESVRIEGRRSGGRVYAILQPNSISNRRRNRPQARPA